MNFFKKIFATKTPGPLELRKNLFLLAEKNDGHLPALCAEHRETILAHFESWRRVPAEIRKKPDELNRYAHGLMAIATIFANHLHNPGLLAMLQEPAESNPVKAIQTRLEECQSHLQHMRFEKAYALAEKIVSDLKAATEGTLHTYLPYAYGFAGESLFQLGQPEEASGPMKQALQLCVKSGDQEGVIAYLGNLLEIYRYIGNGDGAAEFAQMLAVALERTGDRERAARYRRKTDVFKGSEPLNRVVAIYEDREYELDDLPSPITGNVQFFYERNRITLRRSAFLTERGEELGSAGRYGEALDCFLEAARLDAYDPRPHYHAGDTYLYLGQYGKALEQFERTELLAPGWYQCRSDIWLASQLLAKKIDHADFLELRDLEAPGTVQERLMLAEQALVRNSKFAPFYLYYGKSLTESGNKEGARKTFNEGLVWATEDGVRTRLLCHLSTITDNREERRRYVEQAARLKGDLLAVAMATIAL